jgi:alpha/beta hydrolase fold
MPPTFPCVEAHAVRAARIAATAATAARPASRTPNDASFVPSAQPKKKQHSSSISTTSSLHPPPYSSEPEPPYARPSPSSYKLYHSNNPLSLTYAPPLPSFELAYETWGKLSPEKDNAILLFTGLSASSHAAATPSNPTPGWWQKFIGPGKALDTDQFFVICTNVIGGCYGSTGPSSIEPATGRRYATRFPVTSIFDMVRAQFRLLDHLGIHQLYASVGSSMGAMQSLAAGLLHPERAGKIVSISGTARSSPSSIAMRFAQRSGMFLISQPYSCLTHLEPQSLWQTRIGIMDSIMMAYRHIPE